MVPGRYLLTKTSLALDLTIFSLGGYNSVSAYLSTSEILKPPATSFVAGPSLPVDLAYSCMAAINSTHAIFSGGFGIISYYENVYIFNKEDNSWLEIESMQSKR